MVRVPTSMTSRSLLSGSMAVHTQYRERSRRSIASCSVRAPAFTSRSTAYNSSSKRPAGGLGLLRDVFHGLAVASRASNRGHPSAIFTMEFGHANGNINDRFIDQHLFATDPTAIEILLWRGPKGD